jgi:hypothetical protein
VGLLRGAVQLLAAFESSANSELVPDLGPVTGVDSAPVASVPEIGEYDVERVGAAGLLLWVQRATGVRSWELASGVRPGLAEAEHQVASADAAGHVTAD